MKNGLSAAILSSLVFISCATEGSKETIGLPEDAIESTDEHWDQLLFDGDYRITNNTWNEGAASGPKEQTVFITESDNGVRGFGWKWNWTSPGSVVAYPEVIYGVKPWDVSEKQQPDWIIRAGTGNVSVDFSSKVNATGTWNMAFSIWGYTDPDAPRNSISHEIMIWNSATGLSPAGTVYATENIDGREFKVYVKNSHGDDSGGTEQKWTYVAFRPTKPFFGGTLDVSQFLDYLVGEGIMDKAVCVSSVECGNEVVSGEGLTTFDLFRVTVTEGQ